MKNCPDCLEEIPIAATFCKHCGERVKGKPCPDCGTRCWEEARKCRWCGHLFHSTKSGLDFEPFSVEANLLVTFLNRGRFLPQVMRLTREKIVVTTPGVFRLSQQEEEIPWHKVAGFDCRSGVFWDLITIETRGQSSTVFSCLTKSDGEKIRAVLQQMEE
jgi:hypothetical protein